jgi:hypothetical protein
VDDAAALLVLVRQRPHPLDGLFRVAAGAAQDSDGGVGKVDAGASRNLAGETERVQFDR